AWAGTHRLRARYGWQGDGAACLVDADSGMARLEGFEPPTNGFGSHYSIRLSYRRAGRHFPLSGAMLRGSRRVDRGGAASGGDPGIPKRPASVSHARPGVTIARCPTNASRPR